MYVGNYITSNNYFAAYDLFLWIFIVCTNVFNSSFNQLCGDMCCISLVKSIFKQILRNQAFSTKLQMIHFCLSTRHCWEHKNASAECKWLICPFQILLKKEWYITTIDMLHKKFRFSMFQNKINKAKNSLAYQWLANFKQIMF